MKTDDFTSGYSKIPYHVNLEENTPLYLHIVKKVKTPDESGSRSPLKARWIPPPGKTTTKRKFDKRKVQCINSRVNSNDQHKRLTFIDEKIHQLESLTYSLQEIINKSKSNISNEERINYSTSQRQTEKSFLKLYQEQQLLINKCLEVIESSKKTFQQSQPTHRSTVQDACVQAQLQSIEMKPKLFIEKEKIPTHEKNDSKARKEIEHLKKSLSLSKVEMEKCKQQNVQCQHELNEKVVLLQNLAAERDRWKMRLTQITNEKLETETQVLFMKSQVQILQKEVQTIVQQAASPEIQDENEKLRTAKMILENQVLDARNEISHLQNQLDKQSFNLKMNSERNVRCDRRAIRDVSCQTVAVHSHEDSEHHVNPTSKEETKDALVDVAQFEMELSERKIAIENLNSKLEKKELEVNILNDKLQDVRNEVQNEQSKWTNKISSLEASLWNKRSEISTLKRDKQQVEENYLNKLDEVERKLESAVATNRSLQNYISLLRNSYSTVFSDPILRSLPMSSTFLPFENN